MHEWITGWDILQQQSARRLGTNNGLGEKAMMARINSSNYMPEKM